MDTPGSEQKRKTGKILRTVEELAEVKPGSLVELCPESQSQMCLIPHQFMFEEFIIFNRRKMTASEVMNKYNSYQDVNGNWIILSSSGVSMRINRVMIPCENKAPYGLYLGDIIICRQGAAKVTIFMKVIWEESFYWCAWEKEELTGKMVLL